MKWPGRSGWPGPRRVRLAGLASNGWLPSIRPPRTVQARLTVVYVGLFVVFGAALLTITYLLLDNSKPTQILTAGPIKPPPGSERFCYDAGTGLPTPGSIPNCATFIAGRLRAQHASDLSTLLVGSGVALAGMTVLAIGIGWLVAGQVLSPLRTITMAAQRISASNLHQRLRLPGPNDELKDLGDTFDGLLSRLESAFEAQRQFVANASHELRTPLARQRTLVEVALADPEPTVAGLQGVCGRVLAAGEQQERLIEALLTLARSQRGLDRWDQVDLAAVTYDVVLAREGEARRLGVRVGFSTGAPAPASLGAGAANDAGSGPMTPPGPNQTPAYTLGDERLIERLAANLVDNALQHNIPGGWVSVCTSMANHQAFLRVTNSGLPIPPGEVARLFAPFQRLGASRLTPSDGAGVVGRELDRRDSPGLGLSIVSAIAAAHGAEVRANAIVDGGLDIEVRFTPLPEPESLPVPESLPASSFSGWPAGTLAGEDQTTL
jgi:signal transduction histidine kinase